MSIKKLLFFACTLFLLAVITIAFIAPYNYVVPIIMYHNVDGNAEESKLSVSPESFEKHMWFLKKFKYNVISLEELILLMRDKKPIPSKTIVITFDDGYKNNYTNAYPALKKYGLPATIFVIVKEIAKSGYMNWDELREMSDNKITIGSHTMGHAYLTSLDDKTLMDELVVSKKVLEKQLGKEVKVMSYPLGGFNKKVQRATKDAGYIGACATNPGKKHRSDDIYALKRVRISRTSDSLLVFWIETSGLYTWIKEVRDDD